MKNTIQAVGISVTLIVATLAFAKPYPAGIVNLNSDQISPTTTITNLTNHPWTNPNVDGMRVRTQWAYVQPTQNTYDWTGLDEAVWLGSVNYKFIGLAVPAGYTTPQWVYDSGATKYALQDGSGLSMPLPWDPAFLNKWLPFVRALGARYDGNPAVGYVVMGGMSQHFETYIAKVEPDITNLTNLGGPAAWVRAAKQIIAVYAEAFPTTPFFLTLAKPFPNPDGLAALKEVTDWGAATYPGRFGIMNAALNANSSTGYYPNEAVYTYRFTQPTGFQMACSAVRDPVRLGGTLAQALAKGYQLGGKFIEVYEPDVTGIPNLSDPMPPTRLLLGDFNGDGFTDYLLFNPSTRRTAIWDLQGNAFLGGIFGPTLPAGWVVACVADVNLDGKPDYVLFNPSTRQTAVWFLNNAAFMGGVYGPTLPTGWTLIAAADMNNDGRPDYVLFNPSTRQTAVWYLNGTVYAGGAYGPSLPAGWMLVNALDFNGDGKPDFLLSNSSTHQTAIWYLNGAAHTASAYGPTLPSGWTLEGAADFNTDAKPDYVLFQASTRRTAIWYLNGGTFTGGAYGPTLPAGY